MTFILDIIDDILICIIITKIILIMLKFIEG